MCDRNRRKEGSYMKKLMVVLLAVMVLASCGTKKEETANQSEDTKTFAPNSKTSKIEGCWISRTTLSDGMVFSEYYLGSEAEEISFVCFHRDMIIKGEYRHRLENQFTEDLIEQDEEYTGDVDQEEGYEYHDFVEDLLIGVYEESKDEIEYVVKRYNGVNLGSALYGRDSKTLNKKSLELESLEWFGESMIEYEEIPTKTYEPLDVSKVKNEDIFDYSFEKSDFISMNKGMFFNFDTYAKKIASFDKLLSKKKDIERDKETFQSLVEIDEIFREEEDYYDYLLTFGWKEHVALTSFADNVYCVWINGTKLKEVQVFFYDNNSYCIYDLDTLKPHKSGDVAGYDYVCDTDAKMAAQGISMKMKELLKSVNLTEKEINAFIKE